MSLLLVRALRMRPTTATGCTRLFASTGTTTTGVPAFRMLGATTPFRTMCSPAGTTPKSLVPYVDRMQGEKKEEQEKEKNEKKEEQEKNEKKEEQEKEKNEKKKEQEKEKKEEQEKEKNEEEHRNAYFESILKQWNDFWAKKVMYLLFISLIFSGRELLRAYKSETLYEEFENTTYKFSDDLVYNEADVKDLLHTLILIERKLTHIMPERYYLAKVMNLRKKLAAEKLAAKEAAEKEKEAVAAEKKKWFRWWF